MECKQSSSADRYQGGRTWCKTLRDDMDRAVPIPVGQGEDRKTILYFSLLAFLSLSRRRALSQIISQSREEMLRF